MKHILAILISVFSDSYQGKTLYFKKHSPCHRTTVSHFLNKGKWDDSKLEDILITSIVQIIYGEALRSGKPMFCMVDDKTQPKVKIVQDIAKELPVSPVISYFPL